MNMDEELKLEDMEDEQSLRDESGKLNNISLLENSDSRSAQTKKRKIKKIYRGKRQSVQVI